MENTKEEKKVPILICLNSKGIINNIDENHCKRSYIGYWLGLRSKWIPLYHCGDINNKHYCIETTKLSNNKN